MITEPVYDHRRKQHGFTLIEVMVATLLLALGTLAVSAAYKQYVHYRWRMEQAQNHYATALSLRDQLATASEPFPANGRGELNGLDYSYVARQVREAVHQQPLTSAGDMGTVNHHTVLYRISLTLDKREYDFHVLRTTTTQ